MNDTAVRDTSTRPVAEAWFRSLTGGDIDAALSLLDDDVEFVNYAIVPGFNDAMPWIGTFHGPRGVRRGFETFVATCEVLREELVALLVDGEEAVGVVYEVSRVRATGREFEIEFIQWLTVRNGSIVRWKSYTDPSPILRALRADA